MLQILKAVVKGAAIKDVRYYLNSVHCVDGRLESTDGSVAIIVNDALDFKDDILICVNDLKRVLRMADKKSVVHLSCRQGQPFIKIDDFEHPLSKVEGRFPDVKRVVPSGRDMETSISEKGFNNKLASRAFSIMQTAGFEYTKFNVCTASGASVLTSGDVTVLLMGCRL